VKTTYLPEETRIWLDELTKVGEKKERKPAKRKAAPKSDGQKK